MNNSYPNWQPIDTAPKNLSQIILCCGEYVCIGKWDGHWSHWEDSSSGLVLGTQPTFWMHVPKPQQMNRTDNTIDKSVVHADLLGSFRESTNASVWAKAFVEHKNENNWGLEDIDEGLMICWFSNAMMAMHDSILSNE